jgi:DNA polymerase I
MKIQVFDLEANGLLDTADRVWCGVFIDLNTNEKTVFGPDQMYEMLQFMNTCDVLIGHNVIGYDFPLLKKVLGYEYKGKVVDTVLMSRLHNPNRLRPFNMPREVRGGPHSIAAWGYRVGRGKPDHSDWSVFSPEMLHRCSEDTEINVLVYKALLAEAKGMGWGNAYKLTFKLFEILQKQEDYGWLVDRPYMDKSVKLLTHWMDKIDRTVDPLLPFVIVPEETKTKGEYGYVKKPFLKSGKIASVTERWFARAYENSPYSPSSVFGPFSRISIRHTDLNSNQETKEFLLGEGWIPAEWNYKKERDEKGQLVRSSPKLSYDDPFNGISGGVGRLVAKRVQCRHRRSTIEGWFKLIRDDGRIASRVSGIATTGRMKHSGIVNIPGGGSFFGKQMRKCFTCKKGWTLVGTDSAACQLRMLAGRMGDDDYTHEILHGDMHTANQLAAGLDTRAQAKTFIYGFLFGAGDAKIGSIIGGGAREGKVIKEKFLKGLPALGDLIKSLTDEWRSNAKKRQVKTAWGIRTEYFDGWCKGLDGRPIHIASEHQVLVYMLQSDEAIMMTAAYIFAYKRLSSKYKWGEDFGITCFYHDEYTIECREEIKDDVARIAEQAIVDAGNFFKIKCPHEGDAQIGSDWWEIH